MNSQLETHYEYVYVNQKTGKHRIIRRKYITKGNNFKNEIKTNLNSLNAEQLKMLCDYMYQLMFPKSEEN